MSVTVIPVVIGALGTVSKSLERELKGLDIREQIETIQTTSLRVLETWRDLLSAELQEKNHQLTLVWKTRRKCNNTCGFRRFGGTRSGNERKRNDNQIFQSGQRTKKLWNIRVTTIINVASALGTVPKDVRKGTRRIGNQKKNRDHLNSTNAKISQNNQKVLETYGHPNSNKWLPVDATEKNLQGVKWYEDFSINKKRIYLKRTFFLFFSINVNFAFFGIGVWQKLFQSLKNALQLIKMLAKYTMHHVWTEVCH